MADGIFDSLQTAIHDSIVCCDRGKQDNDRAASLINACESTIEYRCTTETEPCIKITTAPIARGGGETASTEVEATDEEVCTEGIDSGILELQERC